jgi:cyclopropane-fatty-acyl-phospholipid synthase
LNDRVRTYDVAEGAANAWRHYDSAEDKSRTNQHYDQPPDFFALITGGEWNTYSCNVWDETVTSETESQERKLDLLARLMDLKAGQRVLDVGCGWGGPIVYLARRYGIKGEGLTLSPKQKAYAEQRAHQHEVSVTIHECHWQHFETDVPFDAVYVDECAVHFNDLLGFFHKARQFLKRGGVLLNKELHFTHSKYMELTRSMVLLNKVFGETGNYRTLHQELAWLDEAGFRLEQIKQMPMRFYTRTVDAWLANMTAHRDRLLGLVGKEHHDLFRKYLRIVRRIHSADPPLMTCDIAVARPVE